MRPPSRKIGTEVRRRNLTLGRSKKTEGRGKVFKKLQISKKIVPERLQVRNNRQERICLSKAL